MNEDKLYNDLISKARFPAPSADLHARIMNSIASYPLPAFSAAQGFKISMLTMSVVIAAFAAGFSHSAPAHATTQPYYSGAGIYIVNYLGS